ncbi:MAG TPA: hypothetical protein VGG63_11520 [Steroidobacteraceae bacterium]
MDRTLLKDHLAQAERHIATGERTLDQQRELIRDLERDGHDARSARALLESFEQLQTLHFADRERILDELAAAG